MARNENAEGPDVKAAVQRQFEQVAAYYSRSAVHARGQDLEAMVRVAALNGYEWVLDAGAGTGHTALAFAPHVARVVALDLTPAMLSEGRRLAAERAIENVEFRRGDVESLPFDAGSFHIVASRYSAHHWPHPQKALREFARVLKPGGRVLLSDVVAPEEPALDTFLNAIELLRDPSHVRDHRIGQWLRMFAGAGFEAGVILTWDLWLDFDAWVTRMAAPPAAVAMIKTLFDGAPGEVREAMQLRAGDYSFAVTGALFHASLPLHHQVG